MTQEKVFTAYYDVLDQIKKIKIGVGETTLFDAIEIEQLQTSEPEFDTACLINRGIYEYLRDYNESSTGSTRVSVDYLLLLGAVHKIGSDIEFFDLTVKDLDDIPTVEELVRPIADAAEDAGIDLVDYDVTLKW